MGLLRLLSSRGKRVAAFKCGPDYIDPLFHEMILGSPVHHLDTYFTEEEKLRYLLLRQAAGADLCLAEGVMGYYDGLGGTRTEGSTYDIARATKTPAVLLVDAAGQSLSVAAAIRGFAAFREDSGIGGVILNRCSPMLYARLRACIEEETGVRCFGYIPRQEQMHLPSRHLGLCLPGEMPDLKEKVDRFAALLEETLDVDGLLELAGSAPLIDGYRSVIKKAAPVTLAVARDAAFCFLYPENLELLEEMGARLVFFSPLRDPVLPEADGLILCGGYPELHLKTLSENTRMRESIRGALAGGMPYLAECGGFMYLHREAEDMEGRCWPLAGVFDGRTYHSGHLVRFGYMTLRSAPQSPGAALLGGEGIRGHEFHYYESSDPGEDGLAVKTLGERAYRCMHASGRAAAGFPHLFYESDPAFVRRFLEQAARYRAG